MSVIQPCTGCGGRTVLLQFDGVYYFTSCEQCHKSGPRGDTAEEAVEFWNSDSSTMFQYGEDLRRSRIIKRMECEDRRDERIGLQIPAVLSVGGMRGRRVTGTMRNVSNYGAYLELTGGDMSAIPVDMEDLQQMESVVFFKLPKPLCATGAETLQALQFSARHMYQRREVLGVGGCFVQLKRNQVDALSRLVGHAQGALNGESGRA